MILFQLLCTFTLFRTIWCAPTVINIIHISEGNNSVADFAVRAAEEHIHSQWTDELFVNIVRVGSNASNLPELRDEVCSQHSALVHSGAIVHGFLNTVRTPQLALYSWLLAMHSQLPTATVSHSIATSNRHREVLIAGIVAANATTQCPCFPQMLRPNRNMFEAISPLDIIPEVVRLLVQEMRMDSVGVLYDHEFASVGQNQLLLANTKARHVIRPLRAGDQLPGQLEGLRKIGINNYFVLGTLQTFEWVLRTLAASDLLGHNFLWVLVTHEMGSPLFCPRHGRYLRIGPQSIGAMTSILAETYFQLTIEQALFLHTAHANISFADTGTGCQQRDPEVIYERLESRFREANVSNQVQQHFEFTMDVGVMRCSEDEDRVATATVVAEWNAWFTEPLQVLRPQELANLTAVVLYQVSTVLKTPFVMLDPKSATGFAGYCIDLLDELARVVGFEYQISLAPDGRAGNLNENGTWDGVVQELLHRRAHIGLGAISVMAERENVIDFTVPYYDLVGIAIMMKIPYVSADYFRFLTVMESEVWLCILAAYVVTSIVLWLTDRLSPFSYQNHPQGGAELSRRVFDLKESLWFCLMSLTPQGGGRLPRSMSSQCVVASWWLYGFIMIASYTANLAAFLTVNRLDTSVENLDDLIAQYDFEYAPLPDTMEWTYFERMAAIEARFYRIWTDLTMNDSLSAAERRSLTVWEYPLSNKYTRIWQQIQEVRHPTSLAEAVQMVRNSTGTGGFAFLGDAADIQYLALQHCDLRMVGEEFSRKPYAVAVQQGSPLKETFDREIVRLQSTRWLEKLKTKWWPRPQFQTGRCASQPGHFGGIGIENIGGFFVMMVTGIGLAVVALVVEWLFFRQRARARVNPLRTSLAKRPAVRQPILNAGLQMAGGVMPDKVAGQLPRRNSIAWAESWTRRAEAEDGSEDVAQTLANIVKCRQRRRRLSRSFCLEEDDEEICKISSCDL